MKNSFVLLLLFNQACLCVKLPPAPILPITNKTNTAILPKEEIKVDLTAEYNFDLLNSFMQDTDEAPLKLEQFLAVGNPGVKNACELYTDARFLLLPKSKKDYVIKKCRNYYSWENLNQKFYKYVVVANYISNPDFQVMLDLAYANYIQIVYQALMNQGDNLAQKDYHLLYSTYYDEAFFSYYNIYCTMSPRVIYDASLEKNVDYNPYGNPNFTLCASATYENNAATNKPIATFLNLGNLEFMSNLSIAFNDIFKNILNNLVSKLRYSSTTYTQSDIYKFGIQQNIQYFAMSNTPTLSAAINPIDIHTNLQNIKTYCLPSAIDIYTSWDIGRATINYTNINT